jgi:hypothetical protein
MLLMTTAVRLLAGLLLLAGGLAGASLAHPDLSAALGWQAIPAASKQDPDIEKGQIIVKRIMAKERVIVALVEGNLGLFEAAAWFRELNQWPPELADVHWQSLPGRSDGEKLCRQVLHWTRIRLEETVTASQAHARLEALEAELADHIACRGKVVLPPS